MRSRRRSPERTRCAPRFVTVARISTSASPGIVNERTPLEPAICSSSSRRARPCRSRRSSRPRRSSAASRAGRCRTARSRRRRTRRSRSRSTASGARANSGEGGENPDRYRDERNCKIKQVASGQVRRHGRVRRLRRGAPDQDRARIEAGRGRPDPGAQGHGGDRRPSQDAARRLAHLAAAAPRHLLDRGPRPARLRPARGQPGRGHLGEARRRDRHRPRCRGRREGARGRDPRRRLGRRHRREPPVVDQVRRRAVGARARGDAAGARREPPPRPRARARRRRVQDRT